MLPGLTIHEHIDRVAASRGLAPTWAQKAQIDSIVGTLAEMGDDGLNVEGLPLDAWIAGQLGGMNVARAAPQPAPRAPANDDLARGILRIGSSVQYGRPVGDAFADIVRGWQAADAAKLAREAATWPNPWRKGQENRTRQTIINKTDPARAARYRAEAGL